MVLAVYSLFFYTMSANVHITTDASFDTDIASGITLVDFWAEWCGPCQVMIPRLEELAIKMGAKAKIAKMNVDEHPQTPQKFRIMSIPTMILFKDGKPVEQVVGVRSVDELVTMIQKYA